MRGGGVSAGLAPVLALLLGAGGAAAHAQPSAAAPMPLSTDASAAFTTPVSITSAAPLDFGELAIPREGVCQYALAPDATLTPSGGPGCQRLSGTPLSAVFTVGCAADRLVGFELIYQDTAPLGAAFSAPEDPVSVDGRAPGARIQLHPCDADGRSEVRAGGLLTLSPETRDAALAVVGTLTLEAQYE